MLKRLVRTNLKHLPRCKVTKVVDGNGACSHVAYSLIEDAFIYPITPSSPMAENIDKYVAEGRLNCFGQSVKVTEMQSEGGAAGAVHGSLACGGLTSTFTASQGLLLMLPNMYKIAGECMPCVFHVAARAVAGQALSIYGDHQDVMATRASGFSLLCSSSVQECHDFALVSHLSSLESSLPFCHFFDGFRTSHEYHKIELLEYSEISELICYDDIIAFKNEGLCPEHPHQRGTAQSPDIYFQLNERANALYETIPDIVETTMKRVSEVTGREYGLFDYVGHSEAEHVIVMMGSGSEAAEETIDFLCRQNANTKIGLIKVRLFRPWAADRFLSVLPSTVKTIAVLDRTKEPGSFGEPLYLEVATTIQDDPSLKDVTVVGGRYGLGSKEFTPALVKSVFDNLTLDDPKNHFTVGIVDDVTMTSLPVPDEQLNCTPEGTVQCMFWGLGGDGTVGANHMAIEIIGDNTDMHAQGYFAYDAKKSGSLTVSHLRFGVEPIQGTYLIQHADFVACHMATYVYKYDMLKSLKTGGTFVLNAPWTTLAELEENLPGSVKRGLAEKKARLYVIDAVKIAQDVGLGARINMVMQTVFFSLSQVLDEELSMRLLKESTEEAFQKAGPDVVEMNFNAIDASLANLFEVDVPASWADASLEVEHSFEGSHFIENIMDPVVKLRGDDLPVSVFSPGGKFPTATSKLEKRGVSYQVPTWKPETCIQCNTCAFVCPHAVMRPFLLTDEEVAAAPDEGFVTLPVTDKKLQGYHLRIQPSSLDCTGCGNCVEACPTSPKSLEFIDLVEARELNEPEHWEYAVSLPHKDTSALKKFSLKGSAFLYPYLEFHGACAGCGEAAYVRLLSQLFGKNLIMANATGCSSIWGGYAPSCPYTVDDEGEGPAWGNSLFEDNAEYGLGMAIASRHNRDHVRLMTEKCLDEGIVNDADAGELKEAMENWLINYDDTDESRVWGSRIKELLPADDEISDAALRWVKDKSDSLAKKCFWMLGGDGWAYDIGFGGLIHSLASGEDINVFVIDTEVYSNTGGQSSKATPPGAVAGFAAAGKPTSKADLGAIAMSLGNVYVASVSMGANRNQLLKAFQEAEEYDGPSLILGYSPCIGHGITGMMRETQYEQELAAKSGYWPLYRYDPRKENPFQLDQKKIDISRLDELLERETRFSSLQRKFPERAKVLNEKLRQDILKRFENHKMLAAGPVVESKEPAPKSDFLVVYGSETGSARNLAKFLHSQISKSATADLFEGNDYDVDTLADEKNLVVVVSTAGQGEYPSNIKDFCSELDKLPSDALKNLQFSVYALGDSSYEFFCQAGIDIEAKLLSKGATPLLGRVDGDDLAEGGYEAPLETFLPEFWGACELEEVEPTLESSPYLISVEKDAKIEYSPYQPEGAELVSLDKKVLMTTPYDLLGQGEREIFHFEFNSSDLSYSLGDSMAIFPHNPQDCVDRALKLFDLDAEDGVHFEYANEHEPRTFPDNLTAGQLFAEILDLCGSPTYNFMQSAPLFLETEEEKESFRTFRDGSFKGSLYTNLDILERFNLKIPLDQFVNLVKNISPRFYSIATSSEISPDKIDLCIVTVDWEVEEESRFGLCTGFLRSVPEGTRFAATIHPTLFNLPEKNTTPIILCALGTGVAPFRAFMEERIRLQRAGEDLGQVYLYYGTRFKSEFLYGDEFFNCEQLGLVKNRIAFSREQPEKIYCQDLVYEDREEIHRILVEEGGYFYFCGTAGRPQEDVKAAVGRALAACEGIAEEDGHAMVDELVQERRYCVEAW